MAATSNSNIWEKNKRFCHGYNKLEVASEYKRNLHIRGTQRLPFRIEEKSQKITLKCSWPFLRLVVAESSTKDYVFLKKVMLLFIWPMKQRRR